MRNLILSMALSGVVNCCAQSPISPAMNGYSTLTAYSQKFRDVFASAHNCASVVSSEHISAGILSERKYLLKGLNSFAAFAAIPLHHSGLGLQLNWFGSAAYNESSVGIVYGRKISERIDIGVQFGYSMFRIPGYGNGNTIQYGMAGMVRLTEKLLFGMQVQNPVASRFGVNKQESVPSIYITGIGYDLSEQFFAGVSIIKESGQPVNLHLGLHYEFHTHFFARAGIATDRGNPFSGVGIRWKDWRLDVAVTIHSQLGITPLLMIAFTKGKTTGRRDEK